MCCWRDQVAWLREDLAKVDRARTPWLIAAMHAPWYNSNLAHQLEAEDMRSVMEPILFSYGVDLVFAGDPPAPSPRALRPPQSFPRDAYSHCDMSFSPLIAARSRVLYSPVPPGLAFS